MEGPTVRARAEAPALAPDGASRSRPSKAIPELRDESARRLGNAALQYAAVLTLAYLVHRVTEGPSPILVMGPTGLRWKGSGFHVGDAAALLSVVVSLAMAWIARSGRLGLDPARILRVGLAYEIVAAFGIGLAEHWRAYPADFFPRGISWACVWITVFPMVLPAPPRLAWPVAFAAATTGPLALLLATAATGALLPPAPVLAGLFVPTYLAATLAAFPARLMLTLRRDVTRAVQMGSYRLVERLGHGGMGEVWRAEHQALARRAALKLIRPDRLGAGRRAEALRRFEREAAVTAGLRSPHTVELFDFGTTEDGTVFYVMELLDGLDLATLVDRFGPMRPARVVHVLLQVCHSLAEAHHRGLVHRDIKPANIHVCRSGLDHDVAKVLDFGLVAFAPDNTRVRDGGSGLHRVRADPDPGLDRDDDSGSITAEGTAPGTPAFMAPEVARGQADVDGRADLYSLGCVAWWLLTGRSVFQRTSALAMMLAHANDPPDVAALHAAQLVPEGLERIVTSCLAKDPGERPQSALVMMRRLAACDAGAPWDAEAAATWWARHFPSQQ